MKIAVGKVVALAAGLLVMSGCCGAGKKIKECSELIQTINEGVGKAKSKCPTGSCTKEQLPAFGQAYEETGKKVEALSISTPELKAQQAEYVAMTKELSKTVKDATSGKGSAMAEISKTEKDEHAIIEKINKTCTAK